MKFSTYKVDSITFTQYEDCCGGDEDDLQYLVVDFLDGGAGYYSVLTTARWAMDKSELVQLNKFIEKIVEHNDKIEEIEFSNECTINVTTEIERVMNEVNEHCDEIGQLEMS